MRDHIFCLADAGRRIEFQAKNEASRVSLGGPARCFFRFFSGMADFTIHAGCQVSVGAVIIPTARRTQ